MLSCYDANLAYPIYYAGFYKTEKGPMRGPSLVKKRAEFTFKLYPQYRTTSKHSLCRRPLDVDAEARLQD